MNIFITGGAGYIGSHTCVELLNEGFDIVVADNLSNSSQVSLDRVRRITGRDFPFYEIDICDEDALSRVFEEHSFDGVIHFAGLKAVGESVSRPVTYYSNNLISTLTLCRVMQRYLVHKIVYSSSATVYSPDNPLPLREESKLGCTNPYGWSKYMCEQILRDVFPEQHKSLDESAVMPKVSIPPGSVILAADDSAVARMMIEQGLQAMNVQYVMTKTGKEAWDKLQAMQAEATAAGKSIRDKVALVLTDLEMPEMDGFTLTRNIKQDQRFSGIPVIIHSSLTGTTNEGHVKSVGADAYVAKFVAEELGATIRSVLNR